ncbi:MAG: DUF2911 domain-containing protein [Gemmatimonadales bacterium]
MTSTQLGLLVAVLGSTPHPQAAQVDTACVVTNTEAMPLRLRESPLDSLTFTIGGSPVKVCYSRPSSQSRRIFGVVVPYGRLWRTGDNEPTMLHTTVPLVIAGVWVPPGSYSLYSIPGEGPWGIIVNRAVAQWGAESAYTEAVRQQEVGRGPAESERVDDFTERFTITVEPETRDFAFIVLQWGSTQVMIPVSKG